jgi:hypothetical protein
MNGIRIWTSENDRVDAYELVVRTENADANTLKIFLAWHGSFHQNPQVIIEKYKSV